MSDKAISNYFLQYEHSICLKDIKERGYLPRAFSLGLGINFESKLFMCMLNPKLDIVDLNSLRANIASRPSDVGYWSGDRTYTKHVA